jgi:hypothetical protein
MDWQSQYIKLLPETGATLLAKVFERGVSISTHYSGCGMAEIALAKQAQESTKDCTEPLKHPALDVFHACEIEQGRRSVLRSHVGLSRARHVFANLLDRYPRATINRAVEAHAHTSEQVVAMTKTLRAAERSAVIAAAGDALQDNLIKIYSDSMPNILPTAFCWVHKRECPVFDVNCKEIRKRGGLIGNIAGTTCTAHSSLGSGLRGVGKSAVAALGWAWERHLRQESEDTEAHEDFFLHECTYAFPSKQVFGKLFPGRPIFVWVLTPGNFGYPCQRRRRFCLVLMSSVLLALGIPSDVGSDWRAIFSEGPIGLLSVRGVPGQRHVLLRVGGDVVAIPP